MGDGRFSGIWTDGELPDPKATELEAESNDLFDSFDSDELAELLQEFAEVSIEALEEVERIAITCESGGFGAEHETEIKRRLHSIKGSAASLGAKGIAEICHEAETAFEGMEPEKRSDMLLRVKDWIVDSVNSLVARAS